MSYLPGAGTATREAAPTQAENDLLAMVRDVAYGEVRVTICGGRIVQLDRTDKRRYTDTGQAKAR